VGGPGRDKEKTLSMPPGPVDLAWMVAFLLLAIALVLGAFVAALFGWFYSRNFATAGRGLEGRLTAAPFLLPHCCLVTLAPSRGEMPPSQTDSALAPRF
jgi:hypothetical protein